MKLTLQRPLFADHVILKAYDAALVWIRQWTLPESGIATTSLQKVPYAEVTGYLIGTLLDCGEISLARQYADYLTFVQRPNGSFCGTDGKEYVFDTAQVLKGLLRIATLFPVYEANARRAADYIVSCVQADGAVRSVYQGDVHPQVHIYILPALKEAALMFSSASYQQAYELSRRYYMASLNRMNPQDLIHFYAYALEGFVDIGEKEFVMSSLRDLFKRQRMDGSIPAYPQKSWVCSVGMAQLAVIGYKTGFIQEADRALDYLLRHQNPSGGFWGSYGLGAQYFPKEEISWAVKFLLDAIHAKVRAFFDAHADIFRKDIAVDDPRLRFIGDHLNSLSKGKILDAGCGKGRFAKEIHAERPLLEIHGVDLSKALLNEAPDFLQKKTASVLCLPYPDEYFDAVLCVEVLEHTIHAKKAIGEMCRVLKNGGTLIIIDKNLKCLGDMEITEFEQWFDIAQITQVVRGYCADVRSIPIALERHSPELFVGWVGKKGSQLLDDHQWHEAIRAGQTVEELVKKIRSNDFPVWTKPLLQITQTADEVLELGCGTAELSAICGIYGRRMHLLDFSKDSLKYAKSLFQALDLSAHFYQADVLCGLPLPDQAVDWVFSSGVLEHFTDPQIVEILRHSQRVSRKGVISLVPNANAIFYRIGKHEMEENKTWDYGRETPKSTMKPLFEQAGLRNIREFSIGTYHSLAFWGHQYPPIKRFLDSLSADQLQALNLGYLLVTTGEC